MKTLNSVSDYSMHEMDFFLSHSDDEEDDSWQSEDIKEKYSCWWS